MSFGLIKGIMGLLHQVTVPTESATFGMGCFWAPDSLYGATPGVIRTKVGYAGGTFDSPTYRNLGDHTEVIQVDYDPKSEDYKQLLKIFWDNHDPTQKYKTQYTSLIFYHNPEQKEIAEKSLEEYAKKNGGKLVTRLIPAGKFFDAENYHQKYRLQNQKDLCKMLGISESDGDLLKTSHVAARVNGYLFGKTPEKQMREEAEKLGFDQKTTDFLLNVVSKYRGYGMAC